MDQEIGVRELRQHLSVYLQRVRNGERLVVTERRRPVALLTPLPEQDDILERLIASGEATRPVGDLLDIVPVEPSEPGGISAAIEEQRVERLD